MQCNEKPAEGRVLAWQVPSPLAAVPVAEERQFPAWEVRVLFPRTEVVDHDPEDRQ